MAMGMGMPALPIDAAVSEARRGVLGCLTVSNSPPKPAELSRR